jgi:hypothetical protein
MVKAKTGKAGRAGDSSANLESWEYGNPEEVVARRRAQSCHGCRHEEAFHFAENSLLWQLVKYCGKGHQYGKRCALYQPKEYDK